MLNKLWNALPEGVQVTWICLVITLAMLLLRAMGFSQ